MKKLIFLLPLVLMLSCSVQKRKYQNGFYISGRHDVKKSHVRTENRKQKSIEEVNIAVTEQNSSGTTDNISASVTKDNKPLGLQPLARPVYFAPPDTCDQLLFRDGKEISARILEIGPKEIRYKKCDMPDGPFYVSRKSDIFMIRYANGTKELFEASAEPARESNNAYNPSSKELTKIRKMEDKALLALILGITGLVFNLGSIPAIIIGRIVLSETNRHPEMYITSSAPSMARIGVILGIVKLVLLVFFIILFIFLI